VQKSSIRKLPIVHARVLLHHFIFSDKIEVKEELQEDDGGELPVNSQKRTASEVCLQLAQ